VAGGTGDVFYSFAMHARIEKDMKNSVRGARRARLLYDKESLAEQVPLLAQTPWLM
jgi:hypothetical protein